MTKSLPDRQRFVEKLEDWGPERVRDMLGRGHFNRPYDSWADEWLEQVEKVESRRRNRRMEWLTKRNVLIAFLALIVGVLGLIIGG